jgi:hypothetical protein
MTSNLVVRSAPCAVTNPFYVKSLDLRTARMEQFHVPDAIAASGVQSFSAHWQFGAESIHAIWCSRFSILARNRLYNAIQSGCCYAALTNAIYEYTALKTHHATASRNGRDRNSCTVSSRWRQPQRLQGAIEPIFFDDDHRNAPARCTSDRRDGLLVRDCARHARPWQKPLKYDTWSRPIAHWGGRPR